MIKASRKTIHLPGKLVLITILCMKLLILLNCIKTFGPCHQIPLRKKQSKSEDEGFANFAYACHLVGQASSQLQQQQDSPTRGKDNKSTCVMYYGVH